MADIKIFETIYHSGQPDGIISIRKRLSIMTAYVIPRPLLAEAKKIKGITRQGIYYLIDESDESKIVQIYIGQTRNGVDRLDDHNRSKDFWNKAILFLADKTTFSLDMISGLEKYAIEKALESKLYKVVNSINPKFEIAEYELPSIEDAFNEIQFIMATQGYKMTTQPMHVASTGKDNEKGKPAVFSTSRNGIKAYGMYEGNKFLLLADSEIDFGKPANNEKYNSQRKTLLEKGDIVKEGGKYILKKQLEFDKPSPASEFVLGSSTNGWKEWKSDDGKTLDEVYRR